MQRKDYIGAVSDLFEVYNRKAYKKKRREAEWLLGVSLERLYLYYSASIFYSRIIRRGPTKDNVYFSDAVGRLKDVDRRVHLGPAYIQAIQSRRIGLSSIPAQKRDYFSFYRAKYLFERGKRQAAKTVFASIPPDSEYYIRSIFYLGVITHLQNKNRQALDYFLEVKSKAGSEKHLIEHSHLNLARIYYAEKMFDKAIEYYAKIPRSSENWLTSLLEASWAFLLLKKANNSLGNIHTLKSPFFHHRFFPEAYIIEAINYLRLCRYKRGKKSIFIFNNKFMKLRKELNVILQQSQSSPPNLVRRVYNYTQRKRKKRQKNWELLDFLARTPANKQVVKTTVLVDWELSKVKSFSSSWSSSGAAATITKFLRKKRALDINASGREMGKILKEKSLEMNDLARQGKLILAEFMLGNINNLRRKLDLRTVKSPNQFIGGMTPLKIGQRLEYWPFEGEYWEDELGGYVYNLASKCK